MLRAAGGIISYQQGPAVDEIMTALVAVSVSPLMSVAVTVM